MKKIIAMLLMVAMLVTVFASCGGNTEEPSSTPASDAPASSDAPAEPAAESYNIVLITMDKMDQHWANVNAGCEKAVAELGNVTYRWDAPEKKDDAQQIEYINNAVASGANAILLAANGPDAVTDALKAATAAGVKIVYVDSPANYDEKVATFSTNNEAAGKLAGQTMLDKFTADGVTEGSIGIISVNTATASTVARENGFKSAFEGTSFEILATEYCEGDAAKSQDAAANFLTKGVVGLFGANEGSAVGVGNAIKESGSTVVGVGFDFSDNIVELLSGGYLLASMVQNPDVMGYEGMKAAVAACGAGYTGDADVDTGVTVKTKDNL